MIDSQFIAADEQLKHEVQAAFAGLVQDREADPKSTGLGLDEWRIYCLASATSTMDVASAIVRGEFGEYLDAASLAPYQHSSNKPAIILAIEQQQGRGRNGRDWLSTPYGGIYITFLSFPEVAAAQLLGCSLAVGVAVRDFFGHYGVQAGLKWPNDVLTAILLRGKHRKLAGVLVELSSSGAAVGSLSVGVGVNLNHSSFPEDVPGASVYQLTGKRVEYGPAVALLSTLVITALGRYFEFGFKEFRDAYSASSLIKGAIVRFNKGTKQEGLGRVQGVCDDGGLSVVTLDNKPQEIVVYSGEIDLEQLDDSFQ